MGQKKNDYFDNETREILVKYQPEGNFEELWKRAPDGLATYRTYKEIKQSEALNLVIKIDFIKDIEGFYMSFIDARGGLFDNYVDVWKRVLLFLFFRYII